MEPLYEVTSSCRCNLGGNRMVQWYKGKPQDADWLANCNNGFMSLWWCVSVGKVVLDGQQTEIHGLQEKVPEVTKDSSQECCAKAQRSS